MQSQRSSSLLGAILSLLGGALVIYGVFFLPMVYEVSEWLVVDRFFHADGLVSAWQVAAVLLALPLLAVLVLFVLVTSAVSFFRELSPKIVTWRRRAAIAALAIQGVLGFFMAVLYTFYFTPEFFPQFGAGFGLVLLGFIVMSVGTFLK